MYEVRNVENDKSCFTCFHKHLYYGKRQNGEYVEVAECVNWESHYLGCYTIAKEFTCDKHENR